MKQSKDSRNALLSVILGDGYLDSYGCGRILHCAKQLDYLTWKRNFLNSVNMKCGEIKYKDNNGFPAYHFTIKSNRWSKFLRSYLYRDGYKNIYKRKLLNRLNSKHLAIWYMDDGGLSQKKRDGVVYANELMLNTHTTKENNQVLIDYFKEEYGVSFTQVKNRGHYRLRCGTSEARKFLDIVREHVIQIPSMAHKLHIKLKAPIGV